jgi:hypothetical protein
MITSKPEDIRSYVCYLISEWILKALLKWSVTDIYVIRLK